MYALITGASSGLGEQFAKQLAIRNYNLILVARRIDKLNKLKEQLEKRYPIQVIVKQCDLSIEKECYLLFEQYRKYNIRILINNAGFGKVGRFDTIPLGEELSMIQTNIVAVHILTKLFVKQMKRGYILNIASIAAFQPGPIMATYGATKAYVHHFSRAINYELKKNNKNVCITTLCPGPVDTEFNKVANANFALPSISAKRCVSIALDGLFQKKELIIPGLRMKMLSVASKLAPISVVLPTGYYIQTKKQ